VKLKPLSCLIVVVACLGAPAVGPRLSSGTVVAAIQDPGHSQTPQPKPLRQPDIFFVPTLESVADQMLKLAGITRADVVYDLGSGDGRILMLAAQKYGARCVGIELDPRLVDLSRGVAREAKVDDRVSFIEGDLFEADISEATIVTIYLSTTVNARLEPKLRQELRPGARVVSHQFPVGRWAPERTERADDGTLLYLWTIPPR
jgi:SAM-dependent methyltransferase